MSHVPRITQPKKLASYFKRCVLYLVYTRTHRQNDYCGHPFRVSGFFPSTYHQGSAQIVEISNNQHFAGLHILMRLPTKIGLHNA